MRELGSGTAYNTHNTTSLIRTLKYVSDILQTEEAFTVEEYTHTHTHVCCKSKCLAMYYLRRIQKAHSYPECGSDNIVLFYGSYSDHVIMFAFFESLEIRNFAIFEIFEIFSS